MERAIEVIQLTKKYKEFEINDLNLSIPKGLATVLIGNNGAGKTTLLKVISGILRYDEGSIRYHEMPVNTEDPEFKESMVYVPDSCCFSGFMDIERVDRLMNLGFEEYDKTDFLKLCNEFEMLQGTVLKSKKISEMSTGNQMKLMLCAMLARHGKYLLLDEPAANLDPVMQDLLQEKMRAYLKDEEHTIIYSTHNIEQVHNVADYAVFMSNGKIIEQGMIDDLCGSYRIVRGDAKDAKSLSSELEYMKVNNEGFDGLGKTEKLRNINSLYDITLEKPNLRDLSVYLLKKGHTHG